MCGFSCNIFKKNKKQTLANSFSIKDEWGMTMKKNRDFQENNNKRYVPWVQSHSLLFLTPVNDIQWCDIHMTIHYSIYIKETYIPTVPSSVLRLLPWLLHKRGSLKSGQGFGVVFQGYQWAYLSKTHKWLKIVIKQ